MACYDLKEVVMYECYIYLISQKREYKLSKTTIFDHHFKGDLPFLVTKFKGGLMVKGNWQNEGIPKGGQMDKGERAF